jgi:predicted nucleic acid-binding OB-fold protein
VQRLFWAKNMNIEEKLIEEYIRLCNLMCKEASDYTNEKVKVHNNAMKQMQSLTQTLRADMDLASKVYAVLLEHEDCFIRQSAATECLSIKIHTKHAISILKEIGKKGNKMAAMAAKRTLLIYKGKMNPDAPF